MDRAQIIARAMDYMEQLSRGVDPISHEQVPQDSPVFQPRLQKCFSFVAELLGELIRNNGFTDDARRRFSIVERKTPFALRENQLRSVCVSEAPVTVQAFLKNINRAVDGDCMEKLSVKSINAWLLDMGYVTEEKAPAVINRTVRRPTQAAAEAGIHEMQAVDPKTGEIKEQLALTRQAQELILASIEEIAAQI